MKAKPSREEPKEYKAFKDMLRRVVKPQPKKIASVHAASDKG